MPYREPPVELPLAKLPWFERTLIAFGIIELALIVIGFYQAGAR